MLLKQRDWGGTLAWPQISSAGEPQQGPPMSVCLSVCVQRIGHASRPPASSDWLLTDPQRQTLKPGQQLQALAEA